MVRSKVQKFVENSLKRLEFESSGVHLNTRRSPLLARRSNRIHNSREVEYIFCMRTYKRIVYNNRLTSCRKIYLEVNGNRLLSVEMFTVTRIRRKPEEKGGFQRIGRPSIAVRYEAALSGVEGHYSGFNR